MPRVTINSPKTPITKGSNGIAAATVPNVCKMPGLPTPLPSIGQSGKSPEGYSKTVTIEGEPVAIRGASFGSVGDIASKATGGGIVSNNVEGPTKFIGPGSMNVMIEGRNVQLLGDQMLNNCGPSGSPPNAATMGGELQAVVVAGLDVTKLACECAQGPQKNTWDAVKNLQVKTVKSDDPDWVRCCILGIRREKCVQKKIADAQGKGQGKDIHSPAGANYDSEVLPKGARYCRPDIVVGRGSAPLNASDMEEIVDLKFPCNKDGKLPPRSTWNPEKALGSAQRECYKWIKLPPPRGDGKADPKGVKVRACGPTRELCG
jgi:uncharacterized Zn-binding protein involved in type VI secretion